MSAATTPARESLFIEHADGCGYLRGGIFPPVCDCGATIRRQLELQQYAQNNPVSSGAKRPRVHYISIEPGRISLHGVSLTDAEYAVLRGIAERMKRVGKSPCLPCPICKGVEGCDHTIPERERATQEAPC